jgi:hypothetical protein
MRWHKEGIRENDRVMVHPSNGEAWKLLDRLDVDFASDARNIHFGLATNDFDPFSINSAPYSCWSIFVVSFFCMKYEFMFLCLIVPGLEAPSPRLNVMLKSLIE